MKILHLFVSNEMRGEDNRHEQILIIAISQ